MEKVFLSDVLKAIKKAYIWNDDISQQILEKEIKQLPSAEKTGEWIKESTYYDAVQCKCSLCGESLTTHKDERAKYCPNCGARMKGEV